MTDKSIRRRFSDWQDALADTDISADVCNRKRALFYDELTSAYRDGLLIIPTPEAISSSPEVAALIAEARREGWNAAKEASEGAIETMLRGIDKMLAEIWGGSRRADRLRSKREQLIFAITAIRALKEETP